MEKLIAAVIGAVIGFLMPYCAKAWETMTRTRRMTFALEHELREISREIQEKMKWVERDVSRNLDGVDPSRIVKTREGKVLYLGERENFSVPRDYWRSKYTEIAELAKARDYSRFYRLYRLVDAFEQKFVDMKRTFDSEHGDKEKMALACLDDLKKIESRLTKELGKTKQPAL